MIFHRIFRFTYFLIFCIWGVQSCTKDDLIETPADTDSETTENPYGIIRIAEKDLTPDVFKLMLQDDEPATILFNNTQRGFRVNQPLQVPISCKSASPSSKSYLSVSIRPVLSRR